MSNHDFQEPSLDDAIDSAVRDIMQRDPRPGLRRRVLSQLDAPAASRSWVPRLLVPFGVLASVALAILVLDRRSPPIEPKDRTPTAASAPAPIVPSPAGAAATTSAAPATVTAPPSITAKTRRRAPRTPTAASSESIFGPRRDRVSAAGVNPEGALSPLVLPALIIQPLNLDALPGRIR